MSKEHNYHLIKQMLVDPTSKVQHLHKKFHFNRSYSLSSKQNFYALAMYFGRYPISKVGTFRTCI